MKFSNIKINIDNYLIIKSIGSGTYSKVKLVKHIKTNKFYALKILNKDEIIKLKQVSHIYNEINILKLVKHKFIVNIIGQTQNNKYIYIWFDFIPGGELFSILKKYGKFEKNIAIFYSSQIILTFEYLHSKNIIYRDLKPENILINLDGYINLIDFGFSKIIYDKTYTICGTPEYLAPEIILQKGHNKSVDWWCLGIFIYEILTGIDPFADDNPFQIYKNILKGKISFPYNFSKSAKSLIQNLLVIDISKRFGNLENGVNDIKNHRWFDKLNWNYIYKKKLKPFHKPIIKHEGDYSLFNMDSDYSIEEDIISLKSNEDPFLNW